MGLFENFFIETKDLFCISNPEGFFIETSPSWEVQLGWTQADLKTKPFKEFLHEDDREQVMLEMTEQEKPLGHLNYILRQLLQHFPVM